MPEIPYVPGKEPNMSIEEEGVFWHKCVREGCERQVEFDDEPWCFTHSPDSGSSLAGYSARRAAESPVVIHKNIFEEGPDVTP